MKETLFKLAGRVRELEELLNEVELDHPMIAEFNDLIVDTRGKLSDKFDSYVGLIFEYRARAEARKTEGDRLIAKAKSDRAKADRLTENMKTAMEFYGITLAETDRYTVRIKKNGGKPPLVLKARPEQLPDEYRVEQITYRADNERLRIDLEHADDDAPIHEFAEIGERGTHVSIT